jgi:hypothetical protein
MGLIEFFATYGEMIIGLTLIALLATYWVLIHRIYKLQCAMEKFDGRFKALETYTSQGISIIKDIATKIAALELIKQGSIHLTAKSSVFGDVNVELDLSKILGEKK